MFRLIRGLMRLIVKISILGGFVGIVIGYANLSDLDGWKRDLSEQMMSIAGRRLSFNGDIDFTISFPPRIVARDVRIGNASWGTRKTMLTVDTLIADVDFLPLLVGNVAVPRVRLVGVDILVETGKNGKSNWDDLNQFQTAAGGPTSTPGGFFGLPVAGPASGFGGISLSGGKVTVANLVNGTSNTVNLPTIPLQFGPTMNAGTSTGISAGTSQNQATGGVGVFSSSNSTLSKSKPPSSKVRTTGEERQGVRCSCN